MKMFKNIKVSNFFGLEDSEDDALDHEAINMNSLQQEEKTKKQSSSPQVSRNQIFEETKQHETHSTNEYTNKKVVEMNAYQSVPNKKIENKRVSPKITVYEPTAYTDCKAIAQALFRKEIVIVTFSSMEELQARRVVDFVTGVIFAVDGDIQRIGEEIFLCTPMNMEVDSTVAQSLISTHLADY